MGEGENDDGKLRNSEVALMDAIRTILEVIVAKGIARPAILDQALEMQSRAYSPQDMPRALFVMRMIRETLTDPERAKYRQSLEQLLKEPPAGSA